MKKSLLRFLASLLLLALTGAAHAALSCTVSVGTLAFGTFTGTQSNSSATMTITCTRGIFDPLSLSYTAALSTGSSGTYSQRLLTRVGPPADTLNYNLYLTTVPGVLNTSVWGDGTGGTIQASGTINWPNFLNFSQTRTHTIAGAIAATSAVPSAGNYQDSITVTLIYI